MVECMMTGWFVVYGRFSLGETWTDLASTHNVDLHNHRNNSRDTHPVHRIYIFVRLLLQHYATGKPLISPCSCFAWPPSV